MVGKIVLILGILGTLLGGAVFLVSVLLPIVNAPYTSWDEAMFGIIPGAVILFFSFIMAVVGLILVLRGRRRRA